ncbi:uncharacterized protein BDR25DRAFT_309073 [Lindgomyces ingoldianus]|uniref:Uncharacterized protein n=1 Tax=Lindgomyces ingoldianus TaxID=673940 RepID=A0ACB6RG47_9PLEO|nr:uncharacterized protein BDR25DRAFT_309073 [Lindgomyces ingoldianus]KAF2478293.1 hypothetical protein BDR25DRAFT_309073 [Lindgomyces ingoldianus]
MMKLPLLICALQTCIKGQAISECCATDLECLCTHPSTIQPFFAAFTKCILRKCDPGEQYEFMSIFEATCIRLNITSPHSTEAPSLSEKQNHVVTLSLSKRIGRVLVDTSSVLTASPKSSQLPGFISAPAVSSMPMPTLPDLPPSVPTPTPTPTSMDLSIETLQIDTAPSPMPTPATDLPTTTGALSREGNATIPAITSFSASVHASHTTGAPHSTSDSLEVKPLQFVVLMVVMGVVALVSPVFG